MLTYSIDPLIKQAAKALELPTEDVNHVVSHLFKEIKRNQREFFTVGFRLEDLGSFTITPPKLHNAAHMLTLKIRRGSSVEANKKILSNLFKFRHQVKAYSDSRKFKKRFGS